MRFHLTWRNHANGMPNGYQYDNGYLSVHILPLPWGGYQYTIPGDDTVYYCALSLPEAMSEIDDKAQAIIRCCTQPTQ